MMRPRSVSRRAVAVAVSVLVPLGLMSPPAQAHAQTRAQVRVQPVAQVRAPDFATAVQRVVATTMPGHRLRERDVRTADSPLRRSLKVRTETVTFAGKGRVFVVARGVGAIREATRAQQPPGTRITGEVTLRRPGAGTRKALLISTADRWGPGLTILTWSERRGVNYQISVNGPVTRAQLVRLAQALPKDDTKVSTTVRTLVAKAKPPVDNGADATGPGLGVGAQGTGNKRVDGVGVETNDLTDEATLCNGCSYWSGNYAGLIQYILYADGKMSFSSIDCMFGSQTAAAAANWQAAHGLAADGIVGPDTRGRMDNKLSIYWESHVDYLGSRENLKLRRIGGYYFYGSAELTYNYTGGRLGAC